MSEERKEMVACWGTDVTMLQGLSLDEIQVQLGEWFVSFPWLFDHGLMGGIKFGGAV